MLDFLKGLQEAKMRPKWMRRLLKILIFGAILNGLVLINVFLVGYWVKMLIALLNGG